MKVSAPRTIRRMLSVASDRSTVRLATIKKRTAEQVASLREELVARGMSRSGTMLTQMAEILKGEIEDYASAVWEEVRDLLEARDRKYFTGREEEGVRRFLLEQLPDTSEGLKRSLRDEALKIGQPAGIVDRLETEIETTCHNARVRVRSEAAKFFDSKRSAIQLLSRITSHPVVSHVVTAVLSAVLAYLAAKLL